MKINEKIKATREDKDIKIKDIAEALEVSPRQINRWESGCSEMGIYKLREMCLFYGVSADYLLGLPRGLKWPK